MTDAGDRQIRPIRFGLDEAGLCAFLGEGDARRLPLYRAAVAAGDAFVLVAQAAGGVRGWAVVHLRRRDDLGWAADGGTLEFQRGGRGYLENLEVAPPWRGQGLGTRLLAAAEAEAARRGKVDLYLHAAQENAGAHRFYERAGWRRADTVHPSWRDGAPMRVYHRRLVATAAPVRLETPRLVLRRLVPADAGGLWRVTGDPEVMRCWHPGPDADLAAVARRIDAIDAHWQRWGFGDWGLVRREDDELLGFAGLHYLDGMREVNLGYALRRDLWRQGLASEACRAVLAATSDLCLEEVVAVIDPDNRRSQRLAEGLGLRLWRRTTWSGLPRLVYRIEVPRACRRAVIQVTSRS